MAGKREEQMKEITERLEQGVQELFTSEKYTEYLKTMAQFHNYSFNNTLLIALQKPDATLLAGYAAWGRKFNRHVRQGEKGIKIIAPAPVRQKEEVEKFDPVTNEPLLRPDGQPETEEIEHIIPRFRPATIFDISQTDGDPIPELDVPELMGNVENFPIFMEALGNVSPVPMRYAEIEGDSKGYYSNTEKEIVIRDGMSEKQTMKTAVHEVTHAMCHDRDIMEELGEKKDRMTKEVEAESVAYSVCSFFGLDTSGYSFPYISGWSSGQDMKELRSSMDFIRKTAGALIEDMTENIRDLLKEKETEQEIEAAGSEKEEMTTQERGHIDESLLFSSTQDRYAIYQIKGDGRGREYQFMGTEFLKQKGVSAEYADYKMVYGDVLGKDETLDSLYEKFNLRRPLDFKGHSLSVSDVVALKRDGEITAHYVDSFGYTELPEFIRQRGSKVNEQTIGLEVDGHTGSWHTKEMQEYGGEPFFLMESDQYMASAQNIIVNADGEVIAEDLDHGFNRDALELISDNLNGKGIAADLVPDRYQVYPHTMAYADEHNEMELYQSSMKKNIACSHAIERAIRDNFDGLHLGNDAAKPVLKEYGAERVAYVLADTVQVLKHGRHFSRENTEWAGTIQIPADIDQYGTDHRIEFEVNSHPAALDTFIGLARQGIRELENIAQYYVISNEVGEDTERQRQYFADFNAAVDAYHQISNHREKEIGMESAEQPLSRVSLIQCKNGIETLTDIEFSSLSEKWVRKEAMEASRAAKDYLDNHDTELAYQIEKGYFSIQTVSDGYDYTIYNEDFREIDGGVYDNPDLSVQEAMDEILTDAGIPAAGCKVMDYEILQERADAVAQGEVQKAQKKAGKMPLISGQTEPEAALNGRSRADIEETALCYAQAQIDGMGLAEEVKLLGARVYGSRSREGLYHEGSDVDVVLSYSGNLKEDVFFNALHEGWLSIAGIPVDINPISAEKTGTLEEYLEHANKYLDEKQEAMGAVEEIVQAKQEATITFYVAECSEFPILGEYHERLETLQEAMDLYEKIPSERMNGIKCIGFCLEDGSIYDGTFDLMVAGEVEKEFINEIPHYRESALVQKAIVDMEAILAERAGRKKSEVQKEPEPLRQPIPQQYKGRDAQEMEEKNMPARQNFDTEETVPETGGAGSQIKPVIPEPEKPAQTAPKTDRNVSSSKKQSVLSALRKRQARMKAQEQQEKGKKTQAHRKGGQEL